jgi:hypothetical protein
METKKYRTYEITFSDEELKELLLPNVKGKITTIVPSLDYGWVVRIVEEDK